jgi:hypothetical protein
MQPWLLWHDSLHRIDNERLSQMVSIRQACKRSLLARIDILPSLSVLSVDTGFLMVQKAPSKLTCHFVDEGDAHNNVVEARLT